MRSFKVYGVKDREPTYVTTVYNKQEGLETHDRMRTEGVFDSIRVVDCLGGIQFERDLRTGEKIL